MNGVSRERLKIRIIDAVIFAVLLAVVSAVTLDLFYRQVSGSMESDMQAYILEMQGLESRYSFPYPVFFKLAAFIHMFTSPELSVAIATMLLNGFGMIVVKLAFNCLGLPVLAGGKRTEWLWRIVLSILAISVFFASMLYPPGEIYLPGIRFRYVGVFSPNPFHNATYIAARPFAILAFLWYAKLLPGYENGAGGSRKDMEGGNAIWDYVLFSLFLFAATMTKPSFTLVMVSAAGLLMLYRLFRAGFRNFLPTIQLGICFIPTFLALLYQYKGVFVPEDGQERGIGFCFGEVWADYCDNIPLGICLAMGFPLLVLALNFREWKKDTTFRFSWLFYLLSFAEAFLLYEKGFRKVDFNFSWGYMYGIFFAHFSSLLLLMRLTGREMAAGAPQGAAGRRRILLGVQWLAYLCHVVCGVFYFRDVLCGGTYY